MIRAVWEAAGWVALALGCGVIASAVLNGIRWAAIRLRRWWWRRYD